jgi:threonine dehydratase
MVSPSVLQQAVLSVAARRRIQPWLTATPCLESRRVFDDGTRLLFKAENFQRTGSFKFRGALSKLTTLATDTPVITASSGNHGLALATAASLTGHQLSVVLPENVVRDKLDKISALGVEVILYSNDAGQAEIRAQELAQEQGKIYVSPYNDPDIIAGQGTLALELLEQATALDAVYVSMGGGGLISGVASVIKAFSPDTRVIGVSASNSAALAASVRAGRVVEVEHSDTLADGCAGGIDADTITLALATEAVDEIIECTEQQIADAMRVLAWQEKMLVEGSAGLALAAWLDSSNTAAKTSAVVLCGANFDQAQVASVLST